MAKLQTHYFMKPPVVFENFESDVKFSHLEEIGHFSVNEEEQYHGDQSQLKYLILPEKEHDLSWDLNEGFEGAPTEGLQDTRRLDHLLRWILDNKSVKQQLQNPEKCSFICNWGVIRSLLFTATKIKKDWHILATRYKGVIYISRTNSKTFLESCSDEEMERQYYWNRKLHQYVTSDDKYGKIDAGSSADKRERYNVVLRRKFGEHQLLYSTAVDAVKPEESQYVLIRRNKFNSNGYIALTKLIKLLIECKKLALKEVLCGHLDTAGIVQKLEFLKTDEISRILRKPYYSEERALGYLNSFLTAVKNIAVKDDPKVVYKFCYDSSDSRNTTKYNRKYVMYEELKNCSPESLVLPEWYISEFEAI